MFLNYLQQDDFIGADMARKFTNVARRADTLIIKAAENIRTILKKESPKKPRLKPDKIFYLTEVDPVKLSLRQYLKKNGQAKTNEKYLQKKHKQMYEQD